MYNTGDGVEDRRTLERQQGRRGQPFSETSTCQSEAPPTHTDSLQSRLDRPPTASSPDHPRSSPPSTGQSRPTASQLPGSLPGPTAALLAQLPGRYAQGPAGTDRYFADRPQTSTVDRQHEGPGRSSRPTPGPSDRLRSLMQQAAPERDGGDAACADGRHCYPVERDTASTTTTTTTPATSSYDHDDAGCVTGSRPPGDLGSDNAAARPPSAQQVVFDWDSVDPQLLDLCRKTSPVLDKNQYWV